MTSHVGILDGSGDIWGVRIADVPGCVGAGATPDEAVQDATVALRDVMAYKRSSWFLLPQALSLADILATDALAPGETTVMIPLALD